MINPKEEDIGRTVIYKSSHWASNNPPETGIITSFNEYVVFVRYGSDKHSKATLKADLSYE